MHISENMWVNIRRRTFLVTILWAADVVPFAGTPTKWTAVTTIKYSYFLKIKLVNMSYKVVFWKQR